MSELAERLEALASRNAEPMPSETPVYTDEEAKEVFLSALEEGKTIPEAAKLAGRTATWFRRRRRREAQNFDVDFAERFEEIVGEGGPWREAICLRMLTAMVVAGENGNVRAQEKLLATYSREFSWLKPALVQGGINVEQLQVFFGELPLEKLLELKAAREQARRELPVIDH
jgi:hypothetical protein